MVCYYLLLNLRSLDSLLKFYRFVVSSWFCPHHWDQQCLCIGISWSHYGSSGLDTWSSWLDCGNRNILVCKCSCCQAPWIWGEETYQIQRSCWICLWYVKREAKEEGSVTCILLNLSFNLLYNWFIDISYDYWRGLVAAGRKAYSITWALQYVNLFMINTGYIILAGSALKVRSI